MIDSGAIPASNLDKNFQDMTMNQSHGVGQGAVGKIKILAYSKYEIKFEMYETELPIANALRRIMISEVPTLTIDLVEMKENTSALHDEFIAHRIGLIPLTSETVDSYVSSEECACQKMCPRCSVNFKMHAVCQSDRDRMEVSSKNIIPLDPDCPVIPVMYEDAEGQEEDPIRLMMLSKNQQLEMNMVAKKGCGKIHAKWSPVSTCTMRKQPVVKLNYENMSQLTMEQKHAFVAKCPRKVFGINQLKQTIDIENADQCSLCQECTKFSNELGLPSKTVQIGENDQRFLFTVEGTGALQPEEIVVRAMKILQGKLDFLKEGLQEPRHIFR